MVEALRQVDLFTGELVDARTRQQKAHDRQQIVGKQQAMFSLRETVEIGVSVRPWLSQTAKPPLELICEDPRTEEEIERDLVREAEALTHKTFVETPGMYTCRPTELVPGFNSNTHEPLPAILDGRSEEAEALTTPLFVSEPVPQPQVGTGAETSPLSGESQVEHPQPDTSVSPVAPATLPPQVLRARRPGVGYRARLRGEQVVVRRRAQHTARGDQTASKVVSPLWMQADHIRKRLPYLGEAIARLDEGELAALAEGISDVLQEAYWNILGITLAQFLNHEQGATTT